MNEKLPSLSVFFPCYNEAGNLGELIDKACAYLPQIATDFEIIIVDDGSTDDTKARLLEAQKKCAKVLVVSHEHNSGYGAALKTGINTARKEWIFWTDGDLQFDITTLDSFLGFTSEYGAIIGYRAHRADTLRRKINGELYTQLINVLFRLGVRDIDCAFKLIRADLLRPLSITSESAFTSAEILIKLKAKNVRFKQIPVPHFPRRRGNPTGGSLRVIFKGLRETILFFLYGKLTIT